LNDSEYVLHSDLMSVLFIYANCNSCFVRLYGILCDKDKKGNPVLPSYGMPSAIRTDTVLPASRCKWMCPALTPARQADTEFTYPGGMEGW